MLFTLASDFGAGMGSIAHATGLMMFGAIAVVGALAHTAAYCAYTLPIAAVPLKRSRRRLYCLPLVVPVFCVFGAFLVIQAPIVCLAAASLPISAYVWWATRQFVLSVAPLAAMAIAAAMLLADLPIPAFIAWHAVSLMVTVLWRGTWDRQELLPPPGQVRSSIPRHSMHGEATAALHQRVRERHSTSQRAP